MKFLVKPLFKENFHYESEKPAEEFIDDLKLLFQKTEGWNFSINLTGEMTDENEFRITPKWQLSVIKAPGLDRSVAKIRGCVFAGENGRAQILFNVTPHYVFPLITIVLMVIGAGGIISATVALAESSSAKHWDTLWVATGFLLFSLIILPWAYFGKKLLKDRFVRVFKLTPAKNNNA